MTKLLHIKSLFLFLSIVSTATMHSQQLVTNSTEFPVYSFLIKTTFDSSDLDQLKMNVFSHKYYLEEFNHDHNHDEEHHIHLEEISLLDIISSDEGADFNCSGGFCMDKSHFHKKGLTLKKQFFGYFMSITC